MICLSLSGCARSFAGVRRCALASALRTSTILALAVATPCIAFAQTMTWNILPQPLASALVAFGTQASLSVGYSTQIPPNVQTPGVSGSMTPDEALTIMLNGTGFSFHRIDATTISIVAGASRGDIAPRLTPTQTLPGQDQEKANAVEEIIVTSQKREENLLQVPVPVGVIPAEKLVENSQVLLRDYYTSVPGLGIQADIVSQQELSIRGITQGGSGVPTVGVTIDDVPYGGSSNATGGNFLPDIDPFELQRVEVLRGPQGTLYGANTMGGVVKFITVDPSTDGYSGHIAVGTSSVYNGAEPGFNLRAAVNVPVSEDLALRASVYKRQDPGYIDNPVLQTKGVNEAEADGARLSALWKPSDTFSLKLGAIYQYIKWNGASDVDLAPGLGPYQQNYIPGMGGYERTVQAYSAVANVALGDINLTSVTGFSQSETHSTLDFSYAYSKPIQAYYKAAYGPAITDAAYNLHNHVPKISEELRLSGSWNNLDWLVGGFYTHERNSPSTQTIDAENSATLQVVGRYYDFSKPTTFEEYSGFADLTYHFSDRFDVQIGGRVSHDATKLGPTIQAGPAFGPTTIIVPLQTAQSNAFTYLFTPRFKMSPDVMIYARLASGFRPGGPNISLPGVPAHSNPDKTLNYEVGAKGDVLNHLLTFDASLYYIDWKNIQITALKQTPPVTQYVTNGSGAKSEGVELSATLRPFEGTTLAGWLDYDDAVLTQKFQSNATVKGTTGDRLPIDPHWSWHISADQQIPLTAEVTGFVGGEISYVGYRQGQFTATAGTRFQMPAYTKTDLRAGVKYDAWTVNFYANNVANVRGVVGGGPSYTPPIAVLYITPRTFGVNLSKVF